MSHWDPALRALQNGTDIYGPTSFIGYLRDTEEDPDQYRTAAELSINTRGQLSNRLDEEDTMVLRLGRATDGPGTQFVLVPDYVDDFFISEKSFNISDRQTLDYTSGSDDTISLGQNARDMLKAYRSLPTFSETSLVNFALSTGILSQALDLDIEQIGTAPTTVASTFDFKFEPHFDHPTVVRHNGGQIEIDALIVTRRHGERILLVIEAKSGRRQNLAKHKLGYPALAVDKSMSFDIDRIVPVYLRARSTDNTILYSIYECSEIPMGEAQPCLAGLEVHTDQHYEVQID